MKAAVRYVTSCLGLCALSCGEPSFEVQANLWFEDAANGEIEHDGEIITPSDDPAPEIIVAFESIEAARKENLRITARTTDDARDVVIPLGTCLDDCLGCEARLGSVVLERLSVEIQEDFSIQFTATRCFNPEGESEGWTF